MINSLFENGYSVSCIIEKNNIKLTIIKDDNKYIFFIDTNYPFRGNFNIVKNDTLLNYDSVYSNALTFFHSKLCLIFDFPLNIFYY